MRAAYKDQNGQWQISENQRVLAKQDELFFGDNTELAEQIAPEENVKPSQVYVHNDSWININPPSIKTRS